MRDGDFRVRGKEISRIEGLSDAVFGFVITLLAISLEVPRTPGELFHAMRGFVPFAITFSVLLLVWRNQFTFFRRYGLEDNKTVFLNAALLFTILFFAYPLKFFFGVVGEKIWRRLGYPDQSVYLPRGHDPQFNELLLVYGIGWCVVFFVFSLLYSHAYSKREELQLTPVEEFDTAEAVWATRTLALVGLIVGIVSYLPVPLPQYDDLIGKASLAPMFVTVLAVLYRRKTRSRRRTAVLDATTEVIEA